MVAGALKISGRQKADIEKQLDAEGYDRMTPNRRGVRACDAVRNTLGPKVQLRWREAPSRGDRPPCVCPVRTRQGTLMSR